MEEKFYEAYSTLIKWDIPHPSTMSEMERQILISYSLVASDILRSRGNLTLAKDYLLDLYRYPQLILHDPRRYKIFTALIDIHCAMGEIDEAESLLSKEMENMPRDMTKSKRRLLVSSLDVSIARTSDKCFKQARSRIAELEKFFQRHDTLDISDQLLHIRALVASARIYHLDSSFTQSIEEWERVKVLAGEYSAFRQKGFTYAFCELSIGYAQVLMALKSIGNAQTIFNEERDNFWIPVIVTDWLPMIRKELDNLLGKRLGQAPLIAE
ncbi:hypothetical protein N7540_013055 [Penicillium herquei]|nr:hypothetical protein N7540_013055 [Penicillium herquei]